ncbi:hypothetical protein VMCG_07755 [Cytospora schulzeri]|uniref:Uncharacterized protein n=1 Tax=Cytospora schulzeri TaxID=448051 RepID=A0A423VZN0_9PEZI|nr:hypothetical protein VMCG_07755 [Valsa malicola]
MASNVAWTRPYQFPEPYYQVPVPGTYPPAYQKIPVSGTTQTTVHPTVYYPQTPQYAYPGTNILPVQAQPQVYYRQPQICTSSDWRDWQKELGRNGRR